VLDILLCVRDNHDFRFVVLAALICAIASTAAVITLRQATYSPWHAGGRGRRVWLMIGGLATGFGIWSTHFIAMLGYEPGFIAGYKPFLTGLSLAIVLTSTLVGFRLAVAAQGRWSFGLAAAITGGGFAAMHYVGIAALAMPAQIVWAPGYLALSIALAVVPMQTVLHLILRRQGMTSAVQAAGLMLLAIVGLHFIGMTAIQLVPARMESGAMLVSPSALSIVIGAASLLVLGLSVTGGVMAQRSRSAIQHNQRQFSILVQGISDCAIYMLDQNGCITSWNAGAQRLKGYTDTDVIGQPFTMFYVPQDRDSGLHHQALEAARAHGKFMGEGWRVRRDGSRFWAHVTIEHVLDDAGKSLGFAKLTRDMSQFKEDQDRLEEARRQLDTALGNMHQGLCLFDARERLVLRNPRFAELWQLPADSCPPGTHLNDVASAALAGRMREQASLDRVAEMRNAFHDSLIHADRGAVVLDYGDAFCVAITSRALPDGGWVTTFEDITERRKSEQRIAHMAHHDILTGLPNRVHFHRWLAHETDIALSRHEQVAMIAIDLDRFKEINDTQGHAVGDAVLTSFAEALSQALADSEIAARLGGDEFAVAKRFAHADDLPDLLARLDRAIEHANGALQTARCGASLGVAILPGDACTIDDLMNNADMAMYRAKASHGQSICFYEAGMDEKARWRRQLSNDLRQAIVRNELSVLYQEQRSVIDQKLTGYEALLRWHHPVHGSIPPTEFIPIAETNGEIIAIGEWVLRTTCAEAAQWPVDLKVAVNLSPVQLLQPDLPEMVTTILLETGISPRRLELEITETAIISDKVRALHSLRRIKALGVSVAIDDFGTGYSSLDTLHSFPFDRIKIDKSFLMNADSNEQSRAIVRAVLALGRSLSIPVLAEGVETREQLAILCDEGCLEAQGYYFGRPGAAPSSRGRDAETPLPLAIAS